MRMPFFNELVDSFARNGDLSDAELRQLPRVADTTLLNNAEEQALRCFGSNQMQAAEVIANEIASNRNTVKIIRDVLGGAGLPDGTDRDYFLARVQMLRGDVPEDIRVVLSIGDSWAAATERLTALLTARAKAALARRH